ncbi:hypothetical protein PAPYR_3793 [Paratrimastix pyriformis]|uniref:Uncharacterized protein n=1 Tax=Paratrimastix pyriformis TaxID=342808 RepID=A0ABQ8UNN1_9EUKA|nr:hypothetical protein PAPYR_3793 [Paratrimastix pyriformis]
MSMADALRIAREWMTKEGLDAAKYHVGPSELQNAPDDLCVVEVNYLASDSDEETQAMSRVLEIDPSAGNVVSVLGWRDVNALKAEMARLPRAAAAVDEGAAEEPIDDPFQRQLDEELRKLEAQASALDLEDALLEEEEGDAQAVRHIAVTDGPATAAALAAHPARPMTASSQHRLEREAQDRQARERLRREAEEDGKRIRATMAAEAAQEAPSSGAMEAQLEQMLAQAEDEPSPAPPASHAPAPAPAPAAPYAAPGATERTVRAAFSGTGPEPARAAAQAPAAKRAAHGPSQEEDLTGGQAGDGG